MVIFLIVVEWVSSGSSSGVTLMHFDPGADPDPFVGLIVHLAVSGVYGLLFGFLAWLLNRLVSQFLNGWISIVTGGVYGTSIFLLPWLTFSARAGHNFLGFSPWIFWLAHVLYGGSLALFVVRMWSKASEARSAYRLP